MLSGCRPGGIIFTEGTVVWGLWAACFVLGLVGAFIGLKFLRKILGARHAGVLRISLCGLPFRYVAGAQSGHKERGGPHTQRPTPHVPGTVIGAASHRYPEFHGRCRRDEESSTTLWCLLARFSRLFPPALSGSDVRLKETDGKRRKLVFPERLRGTLRCPQPAA